MWDNEEINLDEAIARVLGHKEMYKRWLNEFFLPETLEPVKEAFNIKDYDTAHRAVHKIKGTAGNLAIKKLAEQALLLDESIKKKVPFEDMTEQYEIMLKYFNNAEVMFKENQDFILEYEVQL